MIKRLAVLVVLALAVCQPVWAAQTQAVTVDDETFTGTADFIEGATVNIADSKRVTFFAQWDRGTSTVAETAVVTAAISLDGSNWKDISWFDVAGGLTPQTSESLSGDQLYVGYIDPIVIAPYMRIGVWYTGDELTYTSSNITVTIVQDN